MEIVPTAPVKGRRKKLWEINCSYHCSIIGTCLRSADLHKLARKQVFAIERGSNDYQIHSALVNAAGFKSDKSRAMHRIFEQKFKTAVNRFSKITSDDDLQKLWEQYLKRGAMAGAYWAIMTHGAISKELTNAIYGEVHMVGYDFFGEAQRVRRLLTESTNKAELLEEMLVSERRHHLKEKKALKEEAKDIEHILTEHCLVMKKYTDLKSEIEEQRPSKKERELLHQITDFKQQISALQQHNAGLCGTIDELTAQLKDNQDMFELANYSVEEQEKHNAALNREKHELQQEIISLETVLLFKMSTAHSCCDCDDQDTDRCPGPDLCGKTILYVGGQHSLIPRYRQLVERYGGRFVHHDGGKEVSRTVLPKMLSSADAVVCPVDCVSHDACKCVKKICKRYQKPFVMMRSSGLSSLTKGLSEIIQ